MDQTTVLFTDTVEIMKDIFNEKYTVYFDLADAEFNDLAFNDFKWPLILWLEESLICVSE